MAQRFGASKLTQTDVPEICQDPEWQAFWKSAGIYDAVCHTFAVEQTILRNLKARLESNPQDPAVTELIQQLISMGHSMREIDQFIKLSQKPNF